MSITTLISGSISRSRSSTFSPEMSGQHHIHDCQIDGLAVHNPDPFFAGFRQAHRVSGLAKERLEDLPHHLLVVHHEDGPAVSAHRPISAPREPVALGTSVEESSPAGRSDAEAAAGKRIRKRVPLLTSLSTSMAPPCSWTIP